MEFLVALFRALANRSRIRILRLLAVLGQTNVTQIADAIGVEASRTSAHLKILAAVGLIWRRRSGRVVGYYLAEEATHPVTAAVVEVLRQVFRGVTATDPSVVAHADRQDSDTCSDAALFACFTAFTHPRRLQIIRHLARKGTVASAALVPALSMSPSALHRHLEKLERRGLLSVRAGGVRGACVLKEGRPGPQRLVFAVVRKHVAEMSG